MNREPELDRQNMRQLYSAIVTLKTSTEVKNFMRDLCTLGELSAMAERWQVAREIKKGTPYRSIVEKTGSSSATITRVAHWVHHGMGGYKLMLERLKA